MRRQISLPTRFVDFFDDKLGLAINEGASFTN